MRAGLRRVLRAARAQRNSSGPAAIAAMQVITATADGPTNVVSGTYADTGVETSALTTGKTYLVLYGSSCGADTGSRSTFMQLLHGATQIGEGGGEAVTATVTATNSHGALGATIVTGAGDTLKFQAKTSAGTGSFQALWIHAIDVTDVVGIQSVIANDATEQQSDLITADWTDLVDQTWDLSASTRWLFLAGFEANFDAFTAGRTTAAKLIVDGTTYGTIQGLEGENAGDIYCFQYAIPLTITGSKRIRLQGISGGTAETDTRRARLIAIPLDVFPSVVMDTEAPNPRYTTTSGSPQNVTNLSNVCTPTVPGSRSLVLVSGNSRSPSVSQVITQIYDSTNTTAYCAGSGRGSNASADDVCAFLAAVPQLSAAATILPRFHSGDGTNTAGFPSNNSENIWFTYVELAV